MIVRRYGRRSRSMTRDVTDSGYEFGGSESLSQESPQDVYNFAYSSQDSTYWSAEHQDLLSNPSTQGELAVLSSINGSQDGLLQGDLWKSSKKVKIKEDPFSLDSSPESDELVILHSKTCREGTSLGYSTGLLEDLKLPDHFSSNSSQESDDLVILPIESGGARGKFHGVFGKTNKLNENGVTTKKARSREIGFGSVPAALKTTLMETQEFGEMMEHEDEVNFALDGLKKGQPVRVRRGSLLTLLSTCATAQQRRMLRANGIAKTILDVVLGISLDDSVSNLAAVALFYVLTSDGQDDCLLDSPSRIRFLMKLLKPITSDSVKVKGLSLGSKLLSIRMDTETSRDLTRGSDSSNPEIILQVEEVLVSCKDLKPRDAHNDQIERPELTPKWICLLAMEKACLSTVSIEDTGRVRKSGGNFKEKFRELGGLNAVFEIARSCHCIMEGWLQRDPSPFLESKDAVAHENLVLLLKCMQIMENATFLSQENQNHLLGMKGNLDSQKAPRSFIKLILSVIKILSSVSLLSSNLATSQGERTSFQSLEETRASDIIADDVDVVSISSSSMCCTMEGTSYGKGSSMCEDNLGFSYGRPRSSKSEASIDPWVTVRIDSSLSVSCSSTSGKIHYGKKLSDKETESNSTSNKALYSTKVELVEDGEDPFAFDEGEFEPSKWDLLYGGQIASPTQNSRTKAGHSKNGIKPLLQSSKDLYKEKHHTCGVLRSTAVADEMSSLLSDCLLSSVKVLMNLTNDNPAGCQQIAACGGLETLSSLIAVHFPSFRSYLPCLGCPRKTSMSLSSVVIDCQNDKHLTDQQLDLLVAILGLLVNLVEKDSKNRSRLAAVSVSLPNSDVIDKESQTDLISLLCSIFLANQGAKEAAGEGHPFMDDEDVVSQGEKEAEKMIVEAYAALLLAFLSTESGRIRKTIADCLPDHNLAILIPVLERFVEFHLALDMISSETHSTVLEVIESCRIP